MKENVLNLIRPHRKWIALTLAASALLVLVNIALRSMLGASLDAVLLGEAQLGPLALNALAGIALFVVLSGAKAYGAQLLVHRMRSSLYQGAYRRLVIGDQDGITLGEVTSQLSGHVTELVQAVHRFVSKVSGDLCCYVFASVVIASINPAAAAIIVGVSILPTFFIRVLSRREQEERRQYMKEVECVNQAAAAGLQSMEAVKANALENAFCADYDAALETLYDKRKALTRTATLLTMPSVLSAFGMQITILVVSGFLAAAGRITAGEMVTIISLMNFIVDPVMCLENTVVALHTCSVSLAALEPYLIQTPEAPPADITPTDTGIVLEGVSFAYPDGRAVLRDLSLCLRPGRLHILRGANGTGKSTLVRLLCGELQAQQGRICLLGLDAASLHAQNREKLIAVMPQENVMFAGTVLENLRLCQPDATREQAMQACRMASIHEEIMALDDGYDTELAENGGMLSGGQRQRLAFARTLLRDAPIMILDEPSAALDDEHCEGMRKVLAALSRRKIVLVITHDLRLLHDADDVLTWGGNA